MTGLDWTPVLSGERYCSPACGCGCKKAEHDAAKTAAAELAARLGEGWEPRVWENGSWHFSARKGCAEVYPPPRRTGGKYTAYLNPEKQFVVEDDDPAVAVAVALVAARDHAAFVLKQCNEVQS